MRGISSQSIISLKYMDIFGAVADHQYLDHKPFPHALPHSLIAFIHILYHGGQIIIRIKWTSAHSLHVRPSRNDSKNLEHSRDRSCLLKYTEKIQQRSMRHQCSRTSLRPSQPYSIIMTSTRPIRKSYRSHLFSISISTPSNAWNRLKDRNLYMR